MQTAIKGVDDGNNTTTAGRSFISVAPLARRVCARLAAAIHWYGRGEVSQEKAAEIAGLDRTDFLLALAREGEDAFVVDFDDLKREIQRG